MASRSGLELAWLQTRKCLMSAGNSKEQEKQFLLASRWISPRAKQHHWMVSTLPEDSTALVWNKGHFVVRTKLHYLTPSPCAV